MTGLRTRARDTWLTPKPGAPGSTSGPSMLEPYVPDVDPPTATTLAIAGSSFGVEEASISWAVTGGTDGLSVTGVRVCRDGTDITGATGWCTNAPIAGTQSFTSLVGGRTYTLSVQMLVNGAAYGTPQTVAGTPTGGVTPPPPPPPTGQGKFASITMPSIGWFSGASGIGSDGSSTAFGDWRGQATTANANWLDTANGAAWNGGVMGATKSGPVANETRLLDLAIGGPSDYNAAAGGSMDGALRAALARLRVNRHVGGVLRTTIVRPFHEQNGTWYPWSVSTGEVSAFKATARRWRAIQKEVYPELIWALCTNGETLSGQAPPSLLWEDGVWDLYGSDVYNQWPYIGTNRLGQFTSWADGSMRGTDTNPRGVERHRRFAEQRGVPFYIPEYSNNGGNDAQGGDDPYWWNNIFAWMKTHRGKGPGDLFAEIYFNILTAGNKWHMFGGTPTTMPRVAEAYRNSFPVVG